MPTDSTIGTGGDFSTISLWIASLPADLSGTGRHIGRCFNQEFDESVIISGNANPSANDYIELTAADGASFADNDANSLRFDENQGAWIDYTGGSWSYGVQLSVQYTRMNRLQVRRGGTNEYGVQGVANTNVSQCIIQGRNRPARLAHASNCLIVMLANNDIILSRPGTETQLQYITALTHANDTGTRDIVDGSTTTPRMKNVAGFGMSRLYNVASVSGDSTTNASDTADNLTGTDLTNVTFTQTQPFVDGNSGPTTNFKIFTGSALEGAGQPSDVTIDIFGNPRPSSNPSIGCHESQSVGPAPGATQNALFMGHDW